MTSRIDFRMPQNVWAPAMTSPQLIESMALPMSSPKRRRLARLPSSPRNFVSFSAARPMAGVNPSPTTIAISMKLFLRTVSLERRVSKRFCASTWRAVFACHAVPEVSRAAVRLPVFAANPRRMRAIRWSSQPSVPRARMRCSVFSLPRPTTNCVRAELGSEPNCFFHAAPVMPETLARVSISSPASAVNRADSMRNFWKLVPPASASTPMLAMAADHPRRACVERWIVDAPPAARSAMAAI